MSDKQHNPILESWHTSEQRGLPDFSLFFSKCMALLQLFPWIFSIVRYTVLRSANRHTISNELMTLSAAAVSNCNFTLYITCQLPSVFEYIE